MGDNATDRIMNIICKYDVKGSQNESYEFSRKRIASIVERGDELVFLTFTCSTINAEKMFSKAPWEYVALDPKGNNLENDIDRVATIMQEIGKVYPKTKLRILIGNTDPYYIYTRQFSDLKLQKEMLWKKFQNRWDLYRKFLEIWIEKRDIQCVCEVVSWYEFEKEIERTQNRSFESEYEEVLDEIQDYTRKSDLDWELRQLKTQFTSGKYFDGLKRPKDAVLQDWIRRKFSEYAVQALWIYMFMPNALLIQNEKPSDLRTSMYQPLVQERYSEDFPVLYFCGVDNEGYQ